MFIALPNIPYTYNTVVDVSKVNWDVPADVMIAEIRCTPAVVNFKYQMKVRTVMGDDCTVLGRAGDITKIRLNRVYRLGTNPAVRANCITVYGWMREDIKEFLS